MKRKFQQTLPTLSFLDQTLTIPGYTFEKASPWRDTGSLTVLAEGNSLKDGSGVLAKIAPAQSNGSMCLEREAHILGRLSSSPNAALQFIDILNIDKDNGDVLVLLLSHPGPNLLGRYFPALRINDLLLPYVPPATSISTGDTSVTLNDDGLVMEQDAVDIMDLASFLEFAIQATHCLEQLHKTNIYHREIRANAFHLNAHSGLVRFVHTGNRAISLESFGSPSSLVLRALDHNQKLKIKEALCYLAPEQTGSVETVAQDHRTDLYSLGILFWTLLVGRGQMPFDGDSLELLHQIVQKRPMPPHEVRRDVPQVLAAIVEKLLSKNPDTRYQSAYGLKLDLVECQRRLLAAVASSSSESELIPPFSIGMEDRFMEFTLPINLFGRDKELEVIRSIIRNTANSYSKFDSKNLSTMGTTDSTAIVEEDSSDTISEASNRMSIVATPSVGQPSLSSNSRQSPDGSRRAPFQRSRPSSGRTQIIVICGAPGVGKSSMIVANQAKWRSHGLWGQAKFQSVESAPFAAMLGCLSSVLRQLQVFPASLDRFVALLSKRLGPQISNAPLLYQGVPELKDVLSQYGIHPDGNHEVLDYTEELRSRFQVLVEKVFAVVAETRLLALFLDDLHEADESTLDLVSTLVNSKSRMLVFITIRSDKTYVVKKLKSMFAPSSHPTWIDVEPLSFEAILSLISGSLRRRSEECEELAHFIHRASSGNAFSARSILTTLQRQRTITFDWEANAWSYNMPEIEKSFKPSFSSADPNDLTFLLHRLREMPEYCRRYIIWASLFGQTFKVTEVSLLVDWESTSNEEDRGHGFKDFQKVKSSIDDSGSVSTRTSVRGLQMALAEGWLLQRARDMCSFAHDRYRQAAEAEAAALPKESLAQMSLQIILMMLHEPSIDVHRIAEHAKKCLYLLRGHPKREEFLNLLIEAGESAWARGAHELAIVTFQNAQELLPSDPWQRNPQRTFLLMTRVAELSTWSGEYDRSDNIIGQCLLRATGAEDKSMMLRLRSRNHWARNRFSDALNDILTALRLLGVEIDLSISVVEVDIMFDRIKNQVLAIGFEEILSGSRATDPKVELAFALLNDAGASAYWNPDSYRVADIIGLTAIQLALKAGLAPGTAMGFFWALGSAAERRRFYRFSADLGRLGLRVAELHGRSAEKCRARVLLSSMVSSYDAVHIKANIPRLQEAIQYGQSAGDRVFTSFAHLYLVAHRLFIGQHLSEVIVAAEECLDDVKASTPGDSVILAQGLLNCIRALGGYTLVNSFATTFNTNEFVEGEFLENTLQNSGNVPMVLNWYNSYKIPALYCLGYVEECATLGFQVYETRGFHANHRHVRFALFFHSLSLIACLRTGKAKDLKAGYMRQIGLNQNFVRKWLSASPVNTSAWVTLVDAELAALQKKDAFRLYDVAVTLAVNNEWPLEEACGLYLQGSHFIRTGVETLGSELQRRAIVRFGQIGARGVVNYLTSLVSFTSHLPLKRSLLSSDACVQTDVMDLTVAQADESQGHVHDRETNLTASDLSSILKWSKDISKDIHLSSALQRLTEIATETSGAQLTSVAIARDSGEYTVATTHSPPNACQVFDLVLPIRNVVDPLQKAIINHTLNTKEAYHGDAALDSRFSSEASQSAHRSVICLPIFSNRGQTFGCIYMASNYLFSDNIRTILTLLCQQASISIANALLFRSVQFGTRENLKMIAAQRDALEEARKSREDALIATKIKSNFLASMSHELRTPFSSFYGFLDLLNGTNLTAEQEELVQIAKQSCELLLKIIDSILDYSKLEASAVTLELSPFSVENIIADCMELLLPMAARKLDLSYNIERNVPPWVSADYARIRQVLMNLIGNAIKFTERGSIRVICSVDSVISADQIALKFEITDTGIGISDVDQLFRPFQQADNSTTRQFGGTGLGLSISRELVELMNGTIGLESQLHVGSTFWFIIPLKIYTGIESTKALSEIEKVKHALNADRPMRGVICSTSDITRALLQNLLEGFELFFSSANDVDSHIRTLCASDLVLDFVIVDDQSEVRADAVAQLIQSMDVAAVRNTLVVHMFTPTTDRPSIFTSKVPGVAKLTKPPRKLRLLQVLSRQTESSARSAPFSEKILKGQLEAPSTPQRTLFGNILIAEDNAVAQTLLVKQLGRQKLNVIATNNGEAAIREWQAHDPGFFSVALFDHHMPICDGVEATKRLRAIESKIKPPVALPIVALSADAQESTKQLCLSAGMDAFFTKPLKKDDINYLLSMFGAPSPPMT